MNEHDGSKHPRGLEAALSDTDMNEHNGSKHPRGLETALSDTEQQLRRAAQMCRKQQVGAACVVLDVASVMVSSARGLAADAALKGTAGDAANTGSLPSSKKAADATVTPLAEVSEAGEDDADD